MLRKIQVFSLLFWPLAVWAQTTGMTVHEKGGSAFTVSPDDIQKMVIVKDRTPVLQIVQREGAQTESSLTGIDKIVFDEATRVDAFDKRSNVDVLTFVLRPNYPNPFNPRTTIEYDLSVPGLVQVHVYNLNGQEIRCLESGVRPAGLHRTVWDGKDEHGRAVSGGVYLCRVRFGDSVRIQKMLLVK